MRDDDLDVGPVPGPDEEGPARALTIYELRLAAYREISDPLYFEWQRGEATQQEWLDAVAAIRDRYPKHDADGTMFAAQQRGR